MRYFMASAFTVRRLRKKTATRSAFSATATGYVGQLQDQTPEKSQILDGQIGKVFDLFVDDNYADVRVGDEVVVDGVVYDVRGKENINFGGDPHLNLVVVKKDV